MEGPGAALRLVIGGCALAMTLVGILPGPATAAAQGSAATGAGGLGAAAAGDSWSAVATGTDHTCAVHSDGTLWCWGANDAGQLGTGDTTDSSVPVQVGQDADWVTVGAGPRHTCGVRAVPGTPRAGTLWCWGANDAGQLGTGDTTDSSVPVQVGRAADWVDVTPGPDRSCGIRGREDGMPGGTLWCWGANDRGQLGTGDTTDSSIPVQVGQDADWVQVSLADDHTCGIRGDMYPTAGSVLCWGANAVGQVDGTTTDRTLPVPAGGTDDWHVWVSVAAGNRSSCGVRENLSLWCWGDTAGVPVTTGPGATPAPGAMLQVGTRSGWAQVVSDGRRACAVRTDSTLWCWTPGAGREPAPPEQVTPLSQWGVPSLGGRHLCGIHLDGTLWCWGANDHGQLGTGDTTDRTDPVLVGGATRWRSVATGPRHVCGIRLDGTLWCWGYDDAGRLGVPGLENVGGSTLPVRVGGGQDWTAVTTGAGHTCALRSEGSLWCWGDNDRGQFGTGRTPSTPTPTRVAEGTQWLDVSAGDTHTCGVRTDGTLWCWGDNVNGQLGTGDTSRQLQPAQVGTARDWTRVTAGGAHTCGLRSGGSLWCWGTNRDGRLGDGTNAASRVPVRVGEAGGWSAVSVGEAATCGVRVDGSLWCWGGNDAGQLGDGTTTERLSPVRVGTATDWVTVATGRAHACGLRVGGALWCWGSGVSGLLNQGEATPGTPTPVRGAAPWSTLTAGGDRSYGVGADGSLWCWGQVLTPQGMQASLSMGIGSKWT